MSTGLVLKYIPLLQLHFIYVFIESTNTAFQQRDIFAYLTFSVICVSGQRGATMDSVQYFERSRGDLFCHD